MKIKINEPFSIPSDAFAISASDGGYTLAYSADGETFSNYKDEVPAGEVLFVSGAPRNCTYKCIGSSSQELYVQW